MRITIAGHGITLDTADEWVVPSGWQEASLQERHGVYLLSVAHGVQFHVRTSRSLGGDVTVGSLLRELHLQNGSAPPLSVATRVLGSLLLVAGTFPMDDGRVVCEFFVSDGQSVANAALPGTRAEVAAARDAAERLLSTLQFHPAAQ